MVISPEDILLAWSVRQVEAYARDGVRAQLAPLTPTAWSRTLALGLKTPFAPLDLLDLHRPPEGLWLAAEQRANGVLDALLPFAPAGRPPDQQAHARRIDHLHLVLTLREILHISDSLTALARHPAARNGRWSLPPLDASEADRAHLLRLGALEAGIALDTSALAAPLCTSASLPAGEPVFSHLASRALLTPQESGTPVVLISTFAMSDVIALVKRVRAAHEGPIILLADRAHSHLPALRQRWATLEKAFAPIDMLWLEPQLTNTVIPVPQRASPVDSVLAEQMLKDRWPYRAALTAALDKALGGCAVRRLVLSDHLSDLSYALIDANRHWQAPLEIETHSGLPIADPFWLPPSLAQPATLAAWSPAAAQAHERRLGDKAKHWTVISQPPASFRIPPARWALRRSGAPFNRFRPLRIGLLPTTGHIDFTPDTPWAPWVGPASTFMAEALAGGAKVHMRLRQAEGEESLYRELLGQVAPHPGLSFSRAGHMSLSAFLAKVDVCVELGAPSSAGMIASAQMLPTFRLGPHAPVACAREDIFPLDALPTKGAYAALLKAVQSAGARRKLVQRQRSKLGFRHGRLIASHDTP